MTSIAHTRYFRGGRARHSYSVWGLVIALLVTYGFGINRHIHVPGNSSVDAGHTHQAEMHVGHGDDIIGAPPNVHDDADWVLLDVEGPGITKKAPGPDVALALLGALLLLCLLRPTDGCRLPWFSVADPKRKTFHSILPPSRGPPR